MNVLPVTPRLLTVAEYLTLGEPESGYTELVEGRVIQTSEPFAVRIDLDALI